MQYIRSIISFIVCRNPPDRLQSEDRALMRSLRNTKHAPFAPKKMGYPTAPKIRDSARGTFSPCGILQEGVMDRWGRHVLGAAAALRHARLRVQVRLYSTPQHHGWQARLAQCNINPLGNSALAGLKRGLGGLSWQGCLCRRPNCHTSSTTSHFPAGTAPTPPPPPARFTACPHAWCLAQRGRRLCCLAWPCAGH